MRRPPQRSVARLMNVTLGNPALRFRLVRNGDTSFWTPVAKDGFDLPEHQRGETRSERQVSIGETLDVQVRFNGQRAQYVLEAGAGGGALFVAQPIKVRPAWAGLGVG